jgi:hypothetical protein
MNRKWTRCDSARITIGKAEFFSFFRGVDLWRNCRSAAKERDKLAEKVQNPSIQNSF